MAMPAFPPLFIIKKTGYHTGFIVIIDYKNEKTLEGAVS
jgi:hypothetical protein